MVCKQLVGMGPWIRLAIGVSGLALGASAVAADAFPSKPITLIVPFSAGGPTDVVSRALGQAMSKDLGQSVVAGPAMTALLGGQVDLLCDQTTSTLQQISANRVKLYGVTTPNRIKALPNAPTMDEGGVKGFSMKVWHGVYAPKGTPAEITERLSKSLQTALKDPNVVARFAELGTTPSPEADATPAALKAKLESEIARWKPIIEAAGQYAD